MIHDVTANNDFNLFESGKDGLSRVNQIEEVSPPYNEVVLTGDGFNRVLKRYILDYESDRKNICDCCGAPIKTRPWDFEENKTLCPSCEKFLEELANPEEDDIVAGELIDDSMKVSMYKPWDMIDFESKAAVNNILLWD